MAGSTARRSRRSSSLCSSKVPRTRGHGGRGSSWDGSGGKDGGGERGCWSGKHGGPGAGPAPTAGTTCVDEFVPFQVPDAVEDAPADLARVNVPAGRRQPQDGPGRGGVHPPWALPQQRAGGKKEASWRQEAQRFSPPRGLKGAPQNPQAGVPPLGTSDSDRGWKRGPYRGIR